MLHFAASSRMIALASLLIALSGCATTKNAATTATAQPVATDDAASAAGDTPLSFTLVSVSGEASRDSHSTTTTWTINGGHITRSESSSGREQLRGPDGSADASADVTSEASLRRAVNEAAAHVAPDQAAPALVDVTYRSICLELQGHRHCAWQVGNDGPDDAFRALDSLETTLSGEVLAP